MSLSCGRHHDIFDVLYHSSQVGLSAMRRGMRRPGKRCFSRGMQAVPAGRGRLNPPPVARPVSNTMPLDDEISIIQPAALGEVAPMYEVPDKCMLSCVRTDTLCQSRRIIGNWVFFA